MSVNNKPGGMKPAEDREVGVDSGGNSNNEVTRKWNPIPNVKESYTERTKTTYYQGWPFNSYIDERKEANQALLAQLVPPASIIQDVANKKGAQAIYGVVDPATTAVVKTFYNLGKKWNWWGKKDDDDTQWKGRKPAGCLSIAFLQLLYYYRNISEIYNYFPELSKMAIDYRLDYGKFVKQMVKDGSYTTLTNDDVNVVKSIMEKICKAIPVSVYTESGTAVLPIYVKKTAENLHLVQFHDTLVKPSNEDAAKYMYQALCNGILPLVYIGDINRDGVEIDFSGKKWNCFHYFLVDGCIFDKAVFARTGKYADACKFNHNNGWGWRKNGAQFISSMIYDVAMFDANISKVFFFAPSLKKC